MLPLRLSTLPFKVYMPCSNLFSLSFMLTVASSNLMTFIARLLIISWDFFHAPVFFPGLGAISWPLTSSARLVTSHMLLTCSVNLGSNPKSNSLQIWFTTNLALNTNLIPYKPGLSHEHWLTMKLTLISPPIWYLPRSLALTPTRCLTDLGSSTNCHDPIWTSGNHVALDNIFNPFSTIK